MKKAKIMLSAIAILAVVGGAFAFKANKFAFANVFTSYTTIAGGPTYCALTTFKTTDQGGIAVLTFTGTDTKGLCLPAVNTRIVPTVIAQ